MADYNSADMFDEPMTDQDPRESSGASPSKASDSDEEGQVALLPKSIAMGKRFEVGDEIVLRITGIHDQEFEVTYASEPSHKEVEPAMKDDSGGLYD